METFCIDDSNLDGDMKLSKYGQINLDEELERAEVVDEACACLFMFLFVGLHL